MFVYYTFNKLLIPRIQKEQQKQEMCKESEYTFHIRKIQMSKKYSIPLAIKEMQIITTMMYHPIQLQWPNQRPKLAKAGEM